VVLVFASCANFSLVVCLFGSKVLFLACVPASGSSCFRFFVVCVFFSVFVLSAVFALVFVVVSSNFFKFYIAKKCNFLSFLV